MYWQYVMKTVYKFKVQNKNEKGRLVTCHIRSQKDKELKYWGIDIGLGGKGVYLKSFLYVYTGSG